MDYPGFMLDMDLHFVGMTLVSEWVDIELFLWNNIFLKFFLSKWIMDFMIMWDFVQRIKSEINKVDKPEKPLSQFQVSKADYWSLLKYWSYSTAKII